MNQSSRVLQRTRPPAIILASLIVLVLAARLMNGESLRYATRQTLTYDTRPAPASGGLNYTLGPDRWPELTVTYSIRNCPSTLECAVAQQAVRESVEAWDAVSGLTLNEVSGPADINILWTVMFHGDGNPFDGPGLILAHAFPPVAWLGSLGGDVHLDDAEVWVADAPDRPWEVHLQTTVTHEIGHALGLEHSADSGALMWAEYDGIRGIAADDVAGIQAIYGPPQELEPAVGPAMTATATVALRMRSGPGTTHSQIASIPTSTTLPVIGRNSGGDWLLVEYNGSLGWVAAWYCTLSGNISDVPAASEGGASTENPPASPGGITATATGNTRLRSGPGTDYLQVGTVPASTSVTVLARNDSAQWLYVEYQGQRGWIAAWLSRVNGDLNSVPIQDQ